MNRLQGPVLGGTRARGRVRDARVCASAPRANDPVLPPLESPLPRSPILDREEPELRIEYDIPREDQVTEVPAEPADPAEAAAGPAQPDTDTADTAVLSGVARELGLLPPRGT